MQFKLPPFSLLIPCITMSIFIKTDTPDYRSGISDNTLYQVGLDCRNPIPDNPDKTVYTNPEPTSHKPVGMTERDAKALVSDRDTRFGIDQAYFSRQDIEKMIGGNNEIGVRFYLADNDGKKGNSAIIGVGVNDSRQDISNLFSKYKYREDAASPNSSVQNLGQSTAADYVKKADIYSNFSAYFSESELLDLLDNRMGGPAEGLYVYPAKICIGKSNPQEAFTMAATATSDSRSPAPGALTTSISAMPCPPDCQSQTRYIPQ